MTPPAGGPTFAEVFRETSPRVWRFLRRLGVPGSDVEDLCQEVFVIVHDKLPGFEPGTSVSSWVLGIALRVASNHRRRAYLRREQPSEHLPETASDAQPERDLDRRRARARLDALVAELDEDKRAVFLLHDIEQLPMSQVAEIVACPLQTAYSRLYAARKFLEAAVHPPPSTGVRHEPPIDRAR